MNTLLEYAVPVLCLGAVCAGWVLLQVWITSRDPDTKGIERGCGGGCGGGGDRRGGSGGGACGGTRCED